MAERPEWVWRVSAPWRSNFPTAGVPVAQPVNHVYVPDIDDTYKRALAAGAETLAEPKDQFYGERSASVRDPVGNVWHIATKTEDLTVEQMTQRAADFAAQQKNA